MYYWIGFDSQILSKLDKMINIDFEMGPKFDL